MKDLNYLQSAIASLAIENEKLKEEIEKLKSDNEMYRSWWIQERDKNEEVLTEETK